MSPFPVVTVVIPTKEEAADIEGCLAAIAAQDYPINRIEVLVVDGASSDGTADLARRALSRWGFCATAVLTNEKATTSSNLNVGLAKATGDVLCRVDARTRIQPHYVRTCVELLSTRTDVAVVGGAQVAISRDPRAMSIGIARALNNRWSMGGSRYRRSTISGPSDTVYLGAFRRIDLLDEGGWDEDLVSNQDFDLNRRMARRGVVWFEASLRSGYLPRASLGALWRQYVRFGRAKVRYWQHTGQRPEARQWLLLAGPPVAAGLVAAAIASSNRPGEQLGRVTVGLLAGAAVVESRGASEPSGGPVGHAAAVGAMAVVAAGWWSGAVAAALGITARGAP